MRHLCGLLLSLPLQVPLLPGGVVETSGFGPLVGRACSPQALGSGRGGAAREAVDVAVVTRPAKLDEGGAAAAVVEAVAERLAVEGRRLATAASSFQRSLEMNVDGDHEGPEVRTPGPRLFQMPLAASTAEPSRRISAPPSPCVRPRTSPNCCGSLWPLAP